MNELQGLVKKWTEKATSSSLSDDERLVLYDCSKQLHEVLQNVQEDISSESQYALNAWSLIKRIAFRIDTNEIKFGCMSGLKQEIKDFSINRPPSQRAPKNDNH